MAKNPVDKVEDAEILTDNDDNGRQYTVDHDRQSKSPDADLDTSGSRRGSKASLARRSGFARRFDGFVLTTFKFLAIGVLSGAVLAIVAVLVMRQLPSPEATEQSAAISELQERSANQLELHQELRLAVENNTQLIAEVSAARDDAEIDSISTRLDETTEELFELQGQLDLLADEIGRNREQLAQVAASAAAVDSSKAGAVDRLELEVAQLTETLSALLPGEGTDSGSQAEPVADAAMSTVVGAEPISAGEVSTAKPAGPAESLIDAHGARLDELARQVKDIRDAAGASASANLEQIANIESALEQLSGSVESQRSDLRTLAAGIEARSQSPQDGTDTASIVALLALRGAVEQGRSYRDILEAGRFDVSALPHVLANHAESGVPSLRQLQVQFEEYASAAFWVPEQAGEEDGLSDRARRFLGSLVQVRSLQPQEGENVAAILSRATAATRGGDIEQALEELRTLPEQTLEALEEWTVQAESRLAAIDAVDALIVDHIRQADGRQQ